MQGDELSSGFGTGLDLLGDGAADVFMPQSYVSDPLIQDQWTLPRLLPAQPADDDDDLIDGCQSGYYMHGGVSSSTQAIEARRRIEFVANKLGISCGTNHDVLLRCL